jgi:hydrogenase-4 component E
MTGSTYAGVIDLAAGTMLLTGVLIVWRRELRAMVRLLAYQGAALAAIPLAEGIRGGDSQLVALVVVVLGLRAVVLPALLGRAVRREPSRARESTPLLNTTASLLTAAMLCITAFAVSRPLVRLEPSVSTLAVPAALAVVLLAVFVMASRRRAVSQAVGFLMLDNGIAATAFLLTSGVPLIVELGASLDVLFALVVIGVLTGRLRQAFGNTDLDVLRELRE